MADGLPGESIAAPDTCSVPGVMVALPAVAA